MTEDITEHHWERVAEEWIAWTRAPGHDSFWAYVEAFRDFLPEPRGRTLDLGCGEGRISRELTALGHKVTATDIAPSLLAAAEDADSAESYHRADATALPFPDATFDRVIAYNMLTAFTAALTNAGLTITEMSEPRPSESALRARPALAKANRFPYFLWINAQHRAVLKVAFAPYFGVNVAFAPPERAKATFSPPAGHAPVWAAVERVCLLLERR